MTAYERRASSPKLQVLNTALMTAQSGYSFEDARADPAYWGRLVESAVGAHLANAAMAGSCELYYWRERNREVDFVVRWRRVLTALEVKSGSVRGAQPGIDAFHAAFHLDRVLLVGGDGVSVEAFLSRPAEEWLGG